ncbi:MAG: arginine--tRNA ligase, partial [Paludibacteraceae bacterium]|nr:arginine--tRNA ligase [Paludibacteraceae bacterium]
MIESKLSKAVVAAVKSLYGLEVEESAVQLQKTRSEFEGDITLLTFPFVIAARKAPEQVSTEIGEYLVANEALVVKFNVVKGFLNLSINQQHWVATLNNINADADFGHTRANENSPLM